MNDGDRIWRLTYTFGVIRFLALLVVALAAPAEAQPQPTLQVSEIRICTARAELESCRPVDLDTVRLKGAETTLVQTVTVDQRALPLARPLMVWVVALASSEVRWNGVLIGSNGVPAPDRARERPGRFIASFVVPSGLVKAGPNLVSMRLSAHHLWLPVRTPVHEFSVGYYQTPMLPGLSAYLPALLMLGALGAAAIYFGAAAFLDRTDRGALLLAGAASLVIAQLLVETARAFVAYDYPWHLVRVLAVALLSAAVAILAVAYTAQRFAPEWWRRAVLATSGVALLSLLLVPWWDLKALGALLGGLLVMLSCAWRGASAGLPGARVGVAAAILMIALMMYELTLFLDRTYYISTAALFLLLVAEQVLVLRNAHRAREAEALRAAGLERSLERARHFSAEPLVLLKDGACTHRVAPREMLFIKAADDYCEVQLKDGRTLLVTTSLSRLHASLPESFVRIHKSYVVNGDHVARVSARPQGGRALLLSDGQSLPVGRTYGNVLANWTVPMPKG